MPNSKLSAGTAAKQSSKCSLLLRPAALAAILLLAAVACCPKIVKEKRPTINLTQSDLMVIYKNGYINGKLNIQLHSGDGMSDEVWQIDSFNLSKRFFK